VEISGKAQKQKGKLPEDLADALLALWTELKLEGPVQPEWPHFGKLKGRKNEYHCHLNKGRPAYVAHMARQRLAGLDHEEIWIAFVDAQNRLLSWEQYSKGSVGNSAIYPRDILERALLVRASGFILVHNHPGGASKPSNADLEITAHMERSAQIINLRFLDHIIVTDNECYSVMSENLL
jgi:DNA repair protein RadC